MSASLWTIRRAAADWTSSRNAWNTGVLVLVDQVAIGSAHSAFGSDGTLVDEQRTKQITALAKGLRKSVSLLLSATCHFQPV
ncbi:MAG: hypothetical protein JO334_04625 [Verrucomicrobia bacterium]|nr:hypothetical protein [Verrucomicrobiota bacterium]